ncbi:sulfatase family protein [Tautonia marina]|uniref:sulfatase family protein n=1 Tax=Tautonia marina TaxID=2653855 RepID=UPI00191C3457|nr:arylsulfatase [Tautonia marina]
MMRWFLPVLGLLVLPAPIQAAPPDPSRPHIVLILLDDLGFGDLGCNNPDAKTVTPRIDSFASEGLRFTDAHAPGSVCVPSRYGLLTGRDPWRASLDWQREAIIDADRLTLPSLLQDAGYTTAMVGKWHQGFDGGIDFAYDQPLTGGPVDRGFDTFFGMHASLDIPPYFYINGSSVVAAPTLTIDDHFSPAPWSRIQGAFWRAGPIAPGFVMEQVLPRFTDEAIASLDRFATDHPDDPSFLYLALTAPHTPWLPDDRFLDLGEAELYGAFVAHVDLEVGRVLDALDRLGRRDETLVILASDNGPVWDPKDIDRTGHRATGPFRGMKGDAWEGGHRVPFLVRWPGQTPEGTITDALLSFTDLLATFAAIVGRDLPDDAGEDSFNLLPIWRGQPLDRPIRETLVTQSSSGVLAVRRGPWKLIPTLGSAGFSLPRRLDPAPDGPTGQLYHLATDPSEQHNRFADHPEIVAELTSLLDHLRASGRSRPRSAE